MADARDVPTGAPGGGRTGQQGRGTVAADVPVDHEGIHRHIAGDPDAAAPGQRDLDGAAFEAGQDTAHEPAHDLEHQLVHPAFARRADPHAGPSAHGFPQLQRFDPDSIKTHALPTHEDPSHGVRQIPEA
ncbi:hypothetical protein [Streptomyces sp. NPDC055107]